MLSRILIKARKTNTIYICPKCDKVHSPCCPKIVTGSVKIIDWCDECLFGEHPREIDIVCYDKYDNIILFEKINCIIEFDF
jgi:hypothetical protein